MPLNKEAVRRGERERGGERGGKGRAKRERGGMREEKERGGITEGEGRGREKGKHRGRNPKLKTCSS